jgi:hypothetical protein
VINAQSQLVYVQPPGVGGASGSEGSTLATQPTTFNGSPFSISSASGLFNVISAAIGTMLRSLTQSGPVLQTAVTTLAAATLPVHAPDQPPMAVTGDAAALTNAATVATNMLANLGTALTAAYAAAAAANDAISQAGINPPTVASKAQLATDAGKVNTQVGTVTGLNPSLPTVSQAGNNLETAVAALAVATLPVAATDLAAVSVANTANALISATTSAATGLQMAPGSPGAGSWRPR